MLHGGRISRSIGIKFKCRASLCILASSGYHPPHSPWQNWNVCWRDMATEKRPEDCTPVLFGFLWAAIDREKGTASEPTYQTAIYSLPCACQRIITRSGPKLNPSPIRSACFDTYDFPYFSRSCRLDLARFHEYSCPQISPSRSANRAGL